MAVMNSVHSRTLINLLVKAPMTRSQRGNIVNFNQVDLNLLRVFDVLMRERSVTRAAIELGRTQSAVSHSLGKLRHLFKDELFHRDGGEMNPTPKARELVASVSMALSHLRSIVDHNLSFAPQLTRRNFRLGLTDYHAIGFIPGLIKAFSDLAPGATLTVVPVTSSQIGPLIQSLQLDCVILGNYDQEDSAVVRVEMGRDRLVCVSWSGSSLMPAPISLDAYLEATHILISADGKAESLADKALRARGLSRRISATIPTYLAIPWALRGTNLLTHCGESLVLMLSRDSEVTMFLPPIPLSDFEISLLLHRHMVSDPAIVWLRSLIESISERWEVMKKDAWGLATHITI